MKGYLVIAQNTDRVDYIRQAYALALSIKNTQTTVNKFAICVNDPADVPHEYKHAFDYIMHIPWEDDASDSAWKIQNKWKYYYMTPFEETVVLDTDMIFTEDISYWWDFLAKREMWFTTNVRTYRNETVTSDFYRKTFTSNNLPNVYTAFFYFRKTRKTAEVFKLVNYIFKNWVEFYLTQLDNTRPSRLSGDVAYALALQILGYEEECTHPTEYPSFVHMKSMIQNIDECLITDDWTKHFPSYFSPSGELKIWNYRQTLPFHYHIDEWLTDDIIHTLESIREER